MNDYQSLAHSSYTAHADVIAFRGATDVITYGDLKTRCDDLQRQWTAQTPRRVGLWVDHSMQSFISLHALNQMGVTVVCLRRCDPDQKMALCESAKIDHELDPKTFLLKRCGDVDQTEARDGSATWSWNDTQFELQSSGTTGAPKWIKLTTRQLVLSAFASAIRLGHLPNDQWLNVLAPGHMGWLAAIVRCALYGTTVHCLPYELSSVIGVLDTHPITQISLVPSMLSHLVDKAPDAMTGLRTVLVGGGPTPPSLLQRSRSLGIQVHTSWGMTEAASQVATRLLDVPNSSKHVGPPMPFVEIALQHGMLHLSGPLVNEPLLTDDMGHIDDRGNITVLGRGDDVILTSGHKVHPFEVEASFAGVEGIQRCCAVGLPDEMWGQLVVLVIEISQVSKDIEVLGSIVRRIREVSAPENRDGFFW